MTDEPTKRRRRVVTRVRCLDCGNLYAKPNAGGTVAQNPGCPRCGYIGWVAAGIDLMLHAVPSHSGADRQPPRPDRLH